jgi:hypothetical protein
MDSMEISKIMTAGAALWELAAFRHTTLAVVGVIPMYQTTAGAPCPDVYLL